MPLFFFFLSTSSHIYPTCITYMELFLFVNYTKCPQSNSKVETIKESWACWVLFFSFEVCGKLTLNSDIIITQIHFFVSDYPKRRKEKKKHQQVLALPLPANFYRANSLPLPTEDILLKFLVHFGTKKKFKSGKSKNNK